jgi:hypothetical protein
VQKPLSALNDNSLAPDRHNELKLMTLEEPGHEESEYVLATFVNEKKT